MRHLGAALLHFNTLLESESISPADVKLVRHQHTGPTVKRSPYKLWEAHDGGFELYQRIQRRPVFDNANFLASFVATPLDETLFVGLFKIKGRKKAPRGLKDPVTLRDVSGHHLYQLSRLNKLSDYAEKLTIEWGKGYRSWVQRAKRTDKIIVELRRSQSEPLFPGFLNFREQLSRFGSIPISWRNVLSSVGGIYLLTCPSTGKQYVGKTESGEGFWGRWEDYIATGHGGNRRMRDIPRSDYQVSVLEVTSSLDPAVILEMESRWKLKLMSRQFGLNAN